MLGIVTVDGPKIPRARSNLRIALSRTRSGFQQEKGFHVDFSAGEDIAFVMHRIGRYPHTTL